MELFIKRFIDLLDEMAPVSMVHTMIEQPLGAVMNDSYTKIHARLDLIDENSPFVEIELYPYSNNQLEVLLAFTIPSSGMTISEDDFVKNISKRSEKLEKIISLLNEEDTYYEIFTSNQIEIPVNNAEIDKKINEITSMIKDNLTSGGYEDTKEDS